MNRRKKIPQTQIVEDVQKLTLEPTAAELREFEASSLVLNNLVISCQGFIFKFEFEQNLSLLLTNGFDKMYRIELTYDYVSKHRQSISVHATWNAYFNLLKHAFEQEEVQITERAIEIYYPVMAGAKIKGTMELEGEILGIDRHLIIKNLLFEMVAKIQPVKQPVKEEKKRNQPSFSVINPNRKVRKQEGVTYGSLNLNVVD